MSDLTTNEIKESICKINEDIEGLGDGLMNLESQVNNMIKEMTISGITSESGNLKLSGISNRYIVIGVRSESSVVLMPYLNKNGNWYVHVVNASTNENVVKTPLSVDVRYIN